MKTIAACFVLAGTVATAWGQTLITGDVSGRVLDATGAAVSGATVTLKSSEDASVRTVTADKSGLYRFSLLRPGTYSVHEEGAGLVADAKVTVNVGQATSLDLIAKPAGSSTTVEVSTSEPLLQSEDANISYTFGQEQIEALPIPGGDISNLPFSTPGVALSTGDGYGNFTAFGLPGTSNIFTVNGADLMDAYDNLANSGASNNVLGANELNEAAVVVNGYSGQYGRLAGAQVNYTTKSGTNQFHGNANFYYNSSGLNANDWFLKQSEVASGTINAQPHAVSRQWGGAIGGPILRDKLFFFFDDEGLRYVLPGGGTTSFLPSAAFQQATLANIQATQPAEYGFYQNIFKLYSATNGFATAQPSTSADGGCGDFAGTVVGGKTFGAANPCSVSFVPNNNNLNTEQLYVVRVDSNISAKDQLNFRFRHDFGVQATGTDPVSTAFSANSTQPEYDGQINETHVFSPNVVNSGTAAVLYYDAIFGPPNFANALATFPTTFAFTDGDGFVNLGGSDNSYPSGRNLTQYQFVDDLSITHGKNNMKAGFNFRRFDITLFSPLAGHSGITTFASNTDFYNGVIGNNSALSGADTTTQAFSAINAGHLAIYDIGAYFQDQITFSKNLKLTASLRFDRTGNPACAGNCFVRMNGPFDQIAHQTATGTAVPYNQSILYNQRNALAGIEGVTPQPRFGFAYTPSGDTGRTVIRGGVGLFADLFVPSVLSRFITNAPDYVSFTLTPAANATYQVQPSLAASANSSLAASYSAFAAGFTSGATLASLQTATGGRFTSPNYTASVVNNLRNAKFTEYNLEVQQALSHTDLLDFNYVGNIGVDILYQNPTANAYASCYPAKCPNGFGGLPTTQADSRFKAVTNLTNAGHSNYNGITASFRHQGSHGLTFAVNYTYSHSLDNTSNGGVESYAYNGSTGSSNGVLEIDPTSVDRLNYGNSDYDVRHNVNMNYAYSPKFDLKSHLVRSALTGFTIAGTLFAKSGTPYSVVRGSVTSTYTNSTDAGVVMGGFLGGSRGPCGGPANQCLSISQFASLAQQPTYGFGNLARNSFRGPDYFDTDMQFSKMTPITERVKLKVGANLFNIVNHPNFALPYNNLANSHFGQILADTPPVSSPYGNFQGAGVSGRVIQVVGGFVF